MNDILFHPLQTVIEWRNLVFLGCRPVARSSLPSFGKVIFLMLSESPSRFLKACRREPVDATPVWFMRQAGRYMPEYREIRSKMSMLEAIRNPEVSPEDYPAAD